jgi:zinc D-Ala-D-Ala carboxypeptidase
VSSLVRRLAAGLVTAFLISSVLIGGALGSPSGTAAATGTAPTCAYKDVATAHGAYSDWRRTLLDTIYLVPKTYYPPDLVSVSRAGLTGSGYVRSLVVTDLTALATAARAAGARLAVQSSFRSYATQSSTFNYWVSVAGYSSALLSSARPGHSEHQLGTTIDFKSYGGTAPWNYADWATTKAGAWMKANAWRYGFVMSYPMAFSPALTCYQYEPWHYRYYGRSQAAAMHASGLAPRQYLWTLQ